MRPEFDNNKTFETVNDMSTLHQSIDLFSRDPMERENKPFKVVTATQCAVKDFSQKEIADGQIIPNNFLKPA